MSTDTPEPSATADLLKQERQRIWRLLLESRESLTQEYRALLSGKGGLLTSSMIYAYSKGINDAMKLILKENQDGSEEPAQTQEG